MSALDNTGGHHQLDGGGSVHLTWVVWFILRLVVAL